MKAPSAAALLMLAGLAYDTTVCFAQQHHVQNPLVDKKAKEKQYKEACPAYEHYARFAQYCLTCPPFKLPSC